MMSAATMANSTGPIKTPRARGFVFTTNNYDDELYTKVTEFLAKDRVAYAIVGKEVSDTGTPHLQGYIRLVNATTRSAVSKQIPKSFIEVAKCDDLPNRVYCSKGGNYAEFGEIRKPTDQGKRNDLLDIKNRLEDGEDMKTIASDHFGSFLRYSRGMREYALLHMPEYNHDCVRGVWIHGPPGTGKSHCVREFAKENEIGLFNKPQNKWFDGYAGEEIILLDDLDTDMLGHHLKIWSDRYSCKGETKGGTVPLRHHYLVVTSNYPPSHFWPSDPVMQAAVERRFIVQEKTTQQQTMNFSYWEKMYPIFNPVITPTPNPWGPKRANGPHWSPTFNPNELLEDPDSEEEELPAYQPS
ncbi:MAG: putative viral replication protein [Circular genetic element sp.]|nr:MAG: putative viral replication protein [Circular genetic element sp.]